MLEVMFLEFWFPFLLIFARVAAFVAILPFFAWQGVPVMVRAFFAFVLSVLLALGWDGELELPMTDLGLVMILVREVLTGIILGFLVYFFLAVFLMSGQFMDHKAGLMMSGSFDPMFGGQVTLIGQFFYLLAVVFYLSVDGHHLLFLALKESFAVIPLAGPFVSATIFWEIMKTFTILFLLAFQIAAPVVIVLWMLDIGLGFLSKTVPQIHVFIVGLPLKIALVLFIFMLTLPVMGGVMSDVFGMLARQLSFVIEHWYG